MATTIQLDSSYKLKAFINNQKLQLNGKYIFHLQN